MCLFQGDHYSIHSFGAPTISVVEPHSCSKHVTTTLRCIDHRSNYCMYVKPSSNLFSCTKAMELPINFKHCQCEMLPMALIRARMWPANPHFPVLCFSFELMDWVEALLLECQVALKDFCRALYCQCPYHLRQVCVMSLVA